VSERCGIVLHPAGHTLSPALHGAAYAEIGLDATYEAFDVPPEAFEQRLGELYDTGYRQLAVSLPHKESALALASRASGAAHRIGAANTLTRGEDGWHADNTDWIGVSRTLEPLGPWKDQRATVLGAGGAARAVVYALCELGAEVSVVNRTPERAARLTADLGGRVGTVTDPFDLLVNATPVGMSPDVDSTPIPAERLLSDAVVFDTVYRPLETRLLREARARGCRTQDGLEMLLQQAIEQLRIWSGRRADAAALRAVALRELATD